ncbi:HesB/IscA family protein [cyanobacterium endosymbiont of Epithemia turgida]|uniref:HesB/IscA family protein n=1 Tax=cyanobacterium endosymbiont of Epithemia turgida TaxID=718217 RepID=UPI0004D11481|nr:iron-sulfur cluster assembly accessory protein [cyanobacterium endosymbiont of Epithemia turgida isolate EtSB Lake Yunoko]
MKIQFHNCSLVSQYPITDARTSIKIIENQYFAVIMIQITPAAVKEVQRMQSSRQKVNNYFRLRVNKGGCSGLYYIFELSETRQDSDYLYQIEGISVLIDQSSLPYLKELRLDYAEDLMGGGFRFSNPQVAATCSCGLSFTINHFLKNTP